MLKIKWNVILGVSAIMVFVALLAVRLGYFEEKTNPEHAILRPSVSRFPETWMNIYQNRQKIGIIHRKFNELSNGRYQTEEKVTMQINTMGVSQVINLSTETELNPDMSFSSFTFELNSSLFRFIARGYTSKDKLIIFSGLPSAQQKTILPYKDILHISGNIYESAFRGALAKGGSRTFQIFDPSTLSARPVIVKRETDEIIPIMEKRVLTQKFCADFMGATNCAWLDKSGEILKETGILGLSMEKVSEKDAQAGLAAQGSADLTQIASVSSNREIAEPLKLTGIVIKIEGVHPLPIGLHGGRQKLSGNILTVTRENIPETASLTDIPVVFQKYLKSSPLVQSDSPEMKKQVEKITAGTDNPRTKLQKIVHWVYRNVEKKPVLSVPNALEVLKNRAGDCNEHAVLTAALLRAAGIPAQIETGLVYLNGRFYYHAWNLAYIGQLVTVDAVFDQIPADVTHIRLARGDGGEQLNLLGFMGKIKLEVLSLKND